MKHRHLNHDRLTLAAIDSIIERGTWLDWLSLARAIRRDVGTAEAVVTLTDRRLANPLADELDHRLFWRWQRLANRLTKAAGCS